MSILRDIHIALLEFNFKILPVKSHKILKRYFVLNNELQFMYRFEFIF